MNIKLDQFFNYVLLSMSIIWHMVYHYFPLMALGYVPLGISIICFFVNVYFYKNRILGVPFLYWGLWLLFVFFNSFWQGTTIENLLTFYSNLFQCFVVLMIVYVEFVRNREYLFKFLSVCLLIYAFFSYFTLVDYLGSGRLLAAQGNITIINIMFLVALGLLLYYRKSISFVVLLFFIFVALYFTIIGATRKAIGGIAILLLFGLLANLKFSSIRTIVFTLVSVIIAYLAFNYMMENSFLGERFEAGEEAVDRLIPFHLREHWFFKFVGNRAYYYYYGWQLFLDNVIMGIGLQNFPNYMNVGRETLLHTEYMVQLTECGIIGTTLYLLFMGWMAYNLLYVYVKIDKKETLLYIGIYGVIVFISFTAWVYQFVIYYIFWGIIIGYCKEKKRLYEKNRNLSSNRIF